MTMPKSLYENLDLPAKAFFFENDNDKIPEVEGSERDFAVKGSRLFDKVF